MYIETYTPFFHDFHSQNPLMIYRTLLIVHCTLYIKKAPC